MVLANSNNVPMQNCRAQQWWQRPQFLHPYWSQPPRAGSRGHPAGTPLLLREGVPPAGCLRGACGGRRYPPVTGALCAGSAG